MDCNMQMVPHVQGCRTQSCLPSILLDWPVSEVGYVHPSSISEEKDAY